MAIEALMREAVEILRDDGLYTTMVTDNAVLDNGMMNPDFAAGIEPGSEFLEVWDGTVTKVLTRVTETELVGLETVEAVVGYVKSKVANA